MSPLYPPACGAFIQVCKVLEALAGHEAGALLHVGRLLLGDCLEHALPYVGQRWYGRQRERNGEGGEGCLGEALQQRQGHKGPGRAIEGREQRLPQRGKRAGEGHCKSGRTGDSVGRRDDAPSGD